MPRAPYRTEFGTGWIVRDDVGVVDQIELPGESDFRTDESATDPLTEALEQYYAGAASWLAADDLVAAASNTAFQHKVYSAVSRIRPGDTMTYGEVAAAVGHPGAARAVGAAMARNPFPPIIPCHRVVAADGGLGGYAGGLDMKAKMLAMEVEHAASLEVRHG